MDWLFLIVTRKDVPRGELIPTADMQRYAGEIAREGRLRGGAPVQEEATRVHVRGGRASASDGPFAEAKEVVSGYMAVDAPTRETAIALALRCPVLRSSSARLELHASPDRDVVEAEPGRRFALLLHASPDLSDPDGAKYREMIAYDNALKAEGAYVESASLASEPRPARIETRQGRVQVVDGPFAEAKEVVGGYYVIGARDRAHALALAERCPHARWGEVEVREVIELGAPS